jgi:hypothetical protein
MLSIPNQPLLDKSRLIGGCLRLRLTCDASRMQEEVAALPEHYWGTRGGRVGEHDAAQAVFLRGYAPAQGDFPIDDREALAHLPYLRELIHQRIPARPMRCLLALLPGGAIIAPHVDQAPYFGQTIRVHVPIVTHARLWMFAAGLSYRMQPGEIWALNNSDVNGVWNADPDLSRIHMICDFLPSPELLALLAAAERNLGTDNAEVNRRLHAVSDSA